MRIGWPTFLTLLTVVPGCGATVTRTPPIPSYASGSCRIEVLLLPPQAPYEVLGQGFSDNTTDTSIRALFDQGCVLGADALVAPVPPQTWAPPSSVDSGHLAGVFIRRCPASGCPASSASAALR